MTMRRVELDAVVRSVAAETVFANVIQFSRYPDLAPHIASAIVHQTVPGPTGRSSWELRFRSGLLRWTECERFLREELRVEFEQTSGDFEDFAGCWALRQDGPDTALHFQADFDFGIASLAGILDPIAERVIGESVARVVVGMFDEVHLAGHTISPAPLNTA